MNTVVPNPINPKAPIPKSRTKAVLVAGARKRILLVDADAASQTRRACMLRQRGVDVTCAHNMADAKQLWHADSYSLVIVDATNLHDDAVAFCRTIKDERPEQLVTFLVGKPNFLSPSPLPDITALAGPIVSTKTAHTLLTTASARFSRGTGIMNCASQISTRRALHRLKSADRAVDKQRQEISFGEAVRRAGGE